MRRADRWKTSMVGSPPASTPPTSGRRRPSWRTSHRTGPGTSERATRAVRSDCHRRCHSPAASARNFPRHRAFRSALSYVVNSARDNDSLRLWGENF